MDSWSPVVVQYTGKITTRSLPHPVYVQSDYGMMCEGKVYVKLGVYIQWKLTATNSLCPR